LKGFATPQEEQQYQLTRPPRDQGVHMALATYAVDLSSYVFDKVSHWYSYDDWPESSGIFISVPQKNWDGRCEQPLQISTRVLRPIFRSSCLHDKCFTQWVISSILWLLFFNQFIHLHFKWYPPSQLPLHNYPYPIFLLPPSPFPLWRCSFTHSHLTALASPPPQDQGFSSHWCLARPSSATYLAGAMDFGWWFSPWELWVVLLVDIVLPMGLQSPSAPSVLPLGFQLGSGGSVWWLAVRVWICIGQMLVEPLREQPFQVPVSKYFLASAIVWGLDVCRWNGSLHGVVPGWPFLESLFHFFLSFGQERF
jgi:hypothetical protein